MEKIEGIGQNIETVLITERPRLVRLCTRITGQVDVAEDLVQETLLEAWRHLHSLHDPAKFPQWLSGIVRNVCLRRLTLGLCFTLSTVLRFFSLTLGFPLPVLVALYICAGLMIGSINPILLTVEQEIVPVEMRARVFGALSAGVCIGMPLGGLLAGYLVGGIGLISSLLVFGGVYFLSTSSLLINPALKAMDRREI